MADYMKDIYPLIAKPLQIAQQNLNWLKGFQAQQAQQTQYSNYGYSPQGNYPYTNFSNGWGQTPTTTSYNPYSSQYPVQAYNPASSFQMQQLQQLMQQYNQNPNTSTNYTPPTTGNNSQNSLNSLLLPLLLMKLLKKKEETDNDDGDSDVVTDPATEKLGELLEKTSADDGTTDADNDGFIISAADYTALKAAVTDGDFTTANLESALSNLVLSSDLGQVDELATLFGMAQDDGLIDIDTALPPSVLSAMSSTRQELLADSLAKNGLIKAGGASNTDLTNYLINSLAKDSDTPENQFAKLTIKKLVNQWITNPPATLPDADQDQLVNLLKLQGFKFKQDGTLEDDSQQPFPVLT